MSLIKKLILLNLTIGLSFAQTNTATIEIYSPLIDYSALLANDGVDIIDYQVSDLGLSTGIVRIGGTMRVDGVYTTFSGEFNSFTTNQDTNSNGIPDYYEKNVYYGTKMSGKASYSMQGYGNFSANLSANVYKNSGQSRFTLDETITIQSSTINGLYPGQTEVVSLTITPIHATGTINYDPSTKKYSCQVYYFGTTGSSSTSGSYSVGAGSSISFTSLPFPSMGNSAFSSILPALGQRDLSGGVTLSYKGSGNFYDMVTIEGIPYFVTITDQNDADSDSMPDLGESEVKVKTTVNLDGWGYQSWPWVFSNADKDWLYYSIHGSNWVLWRNKTKEWYSLNPNTGSWESN